MNYLTIATDASVRTDLGVAVWGVYIRTPTQTYKNVGQLKGTIADVNLAETMTLANALHIADHLYDLTKVRVILYCDNLQVLNKPKKTKTEHSRRKQSILDREIAQVLTKIESGYGYEYRHVKAHTGKDDLKKYYMNRWCDINSRKLMRQIVRENANHDNRPRTSAGANTGANATDR